jgi:hypothetical protein
MALGAGKSLAGESDKARLHDNTTLASPTRAKNASDTGAATDAAAVEAPAFLGVTAACARYALQDTMKIFSPARFGRPDTAELWFELIVVVHAAVHANQPTTQNGTISNSANGAKAVNDFNALEKLGAIRSACDSKYLDVQTKAWRTRGATASLSCHSRF